MAMTRRVDLSCCLLVGLLAVPWPAALARADAAEGWTLVVAGGKPGVIDLPVVAKAPTAVPAGLYAIDLPGSDGPAVAQVFDEAGKRYVATVFPTLPAEGAYPMQPWPTHPKPADGFQIEPRGPNLAILWRGELVTEYLVDAGAKPFLYPLIGPTGQSYTRAYPMQNVPGEAHDHPHQRSFWFTHGKVNGIDFWSEQSNHGTITETARTCTLSGPVLARLCTRDDWIGPDGQRVCQDERTLTFFHTRSTLVIDLDVTIKAAFGPVEFGDTKEGMFGLRVASSMDVDRRQGGRIVNAEGLANAQAWGKPSAWVDYTGPVHGKNVGIAIMNHPRSFRYPTTWHVRTYGLFAANPFGWHDFGLKQSGSYTLPRDGSLTFAYRVILHEGETGPAGIASAFDGYAAPAAIAIKER